jgi:hypothetical protein
MKVTYVDGSNPAAWLIQCETDEDLKTAREILCAIEEILAKLRNRDLGVQDKETGSVLPIPDSE